MYAKALLKFYKLLYHNADSIGLFVYFCVGNSAKYFLNATNMDKIVLEFTQSEIDAIFDCMIGSRCLDGSYTDLVNYVAKFTKGTGFYCPNIKRSLSDL